MFFALTQFFELNLFVLSNKECSRRSAAADGRREAFLVIEAKELVYTKMDAAIISSSPFLPDELWISFQFIPPTTVASSCTLVSSQWHAWAESRHLWKHYSASLRSENMPQEDQPSLDWKKIYFLLLHNYDEPIKYKIILVGDGGVGKTCFVKRHQTGEFESRYIATMGMCIETLVFRSQYGPLAFEVRDAAGPEKFGGLRDGYYMGGNGAIVMFDVTSRVTYKNVPMWYRDTTRICPDIPVVLVGNKVDAVAQRRVKPNQIVFHRRKGLKYFEVSCKSNYNLDKPFLSLARQLLQKPNLIFLAGPSLKPPEVVMNLEHAKEMEKELQKPFTCFADEDEDF